MLSSLRLGTRVITQGGCVSHRAISTDTHYATIPQPVCLHTEAKRITHQVLNYPCSRKNTADIHDKATLYAKVYEKTLRKLEHEMVSSLYRATRNAMQMLTPEELKRFG